MLVSFILIFTAFAQYYCNCMNAHIAPIWLRIVLWKFLLREQNLKCEGRERKEEKVIAILESSIIDINVCYSFLFLSYSSLSILYFFSTFYCFLLLISFTSFFNALLLPSASSINTLYYYSNYFRLSISFSSFYLSALYFSISQSHISFISSLCLFIYALFAFRLAHMWSWCFSSWRSWVFCFLVWKSSWRIWELESSSLLFLSLRTLIISHCDS